MPDGPNRMVRVGLALPSLISHHPERGVAFDQYMDNHNVSSRGFQRIFDFLHEIYFPRTEFRGISLLPGKIVLFGDWIYLLGFELLHGYIRPLEKHRLKFEKWAYPENHLIIKAELDNFL